MLIGLAAGVALFVCRAASGIYEEYGDFGGLGAAISEMLGFPVVGVLFGAISGYVAAEFICRIREQDRDNR